MTPIVYIKEKTVWQYKVITRKIAQEAPPGEDELNALGRDGWELACVFADIFTVRFYFKRLKD